MGTYSLQFTAAALIVFVVVFVGGRVYLQGSMSTVYVKEMSTAEDLDKITAAHLVKDCLTQGNEYMDSEFLNANNEENVCDLCEICNIGAEAHVKNLENNDKWDFEYSSWTHFREKVVDIINIFKKEKHETHTITVNIKSGDDVHVGELNVEL